MLASALQEPRRRAYLQALGLDLLRAREALPGAAASVVWDEPCSEPAAPCMPAAPISHEPAPIAPAAKAAPASLPAAAQAARDALRGTQPEAKQAVVPAQPVPKSAPPVMPVADKAQSISHFSLLFVPITQTHVALIDLDNQPALEGAEAKLWSEICRAYNWTAHGHDMPAQFSWPIPGLAATLAAAQEALSGWLQTQCAEPVSYVVFGEDIKAALPNSQLVLPSLARLLAEPLRKREVMLALSSI